MTQNRVKIAVTGGIGSGKSTVCRMIGEMGYPVFSCDEIYKKMQSDGAFLAVMRENFGEKVVKEGKLDKEALSSAVFSDRALLQKLDGVTHPLIMERLYAEMKNYSVSFAEVPLLFEGGFEKDFDRVIVVLRKEKDRLAAVCERDRTTQEKAADRMKNQVNYEKIDLNGHTIIYNDGDMNALREKVTSVIEEILG
jgi:dephospho-CoA kinase